MTDGYTVLRRLWPVETGGHSLSLSLIAVRLAPEPMEEAMNWLRRYERFWSASLDRLAAYAEAQEAKAQAEKPQENPT